MGDGKAFYALSGGVDSSTITMLGHRALRKQLKTVFIQNGLMRKAEPEMVAGFFRKPGIPFPGPALAARIIVEVTIEAV